MKKIFLVTLLGRPGTWRVRVEALVVATIPLAACLLVNYWYTQTTLSGVELFARNIVEYTTNPQLSQSAPLRMLRGFIGLSVSPYKGLFWYAPVLLLGFVGAFPFTRRFPWEGLAFLGLIGAHFLGYSRYNYWSGGVAWGSRYMLPVIPFLVMLAAPVWAWLVREQEHEAREEARRTNAKSLEELSRQLRVKAALCTQQAVETGGLHVSGEREGAKLIEFVCCHAADHRVNIVVPDQAVGIVPFAA